MGPPWIDIPNQGAGFRLRDTKSNEGCPLAWGEQAKKAVKLSADEMKVLESAGYAWAGEAGEADWAGGENKGFCELAMTVMNVSDIMLFERHEQAM